ncbi:MAG: hypothetical protein AB7K24_30300, partial [Gemmataceae bacterium]
MKRVTWVAVAALTVFACCQPTGSAPSAAEAEPDEVELDDLRPGLVAVFQSLVDKDAVLHRLEVKPAFYLGHGSVHPRLPAGPFEARYSGFLLLREAAPIKFDAFVCGRLTVKIDGVAVLEGTGESDTAHLEGKQPLDRPRGIYRFEVDYRALADRPARLQIHWQGPSFSREPLPAWQLKHVAEQEPAAFKQDNLVEAGRIQAGLLGCARCHQSSFPGNHEPPRGPSLADARQRLDRDWLVHWLADPAKLKSDAHMPALFSKDRRGFVERWLIADQLTGGPRKDTVKPAGDHRAGRLAFVTIGCIACHQVPDVPANEQPDLGRLHYSALGDRFQEGELASFLLQPHARYLDGRMPRLPLTPKQATDIAAYLLLWSKPAELQGEKPPGPAEIDALVKERRARHREALAASLIDEKRCAVCHPGLGASLPADIAIKETKTGCLGDKNGPRYTLDAPTRAALQAYAAQATRERHASSFEDRRRLIERLNCFRCHQRDTETQPILEQVGSRLGGAYLQHLPFQRTPRLTDPLQKYTHAHLVAAVREGVAGLRHSRYSYRMPAFGDFADQVVRSLAETDGELMEGPPDSKRADADPTLGSLAGAQLIGFQGYSCVSCHIWDGKSLSQADPGAIGPELTRVPGRIRRDWFDRFLENPARAHPGTPMPGVMPKGEKPLLPLVLDGNAQKQKDALWAFLMLGKKAPSPKPPPPLPVIAPAAGSPALVAQIPIKLPGGTNVESICVLTGDHYLAILDVGSGRLVDVFTTAQILREVRGRVRIFLADGKPLSAGDIEPGLELVAGKKAGPHARTFRAYDRLEDGVVLHWDTEGAGTLIESVRIVAEEKEHFLVRRWSVSALPADGTLRLRSRQGGKLKVLEGSGNAASLKEGGLEITLTADKEGKAAGELRVALPASAVPVAIERTVLPDPGAVEGSLERPGFRAIAYPRPKTAAGDDLVMPSAVAVDPETGKVFIASMKL